jgi:hypothetical protein
MATDAASDNSIKTTISKKARASKEPGIFMF